ncbi:hypothetical protein HYR69_00155, partial [Candidatus Sumerlaeota bacterium]|nr:hypothetical protein [Candidatus Sumerlaeota bacterium]
MMPNHYEASHDSKGAPISSGAETAGQLEEISNMDDPKLENAEEAENLNERDARAIAYLLHEMNPAEASAYERQLEADAPSRAQIAEGRQALGLIRGTMLSPPGIQRVEKLAIPRIGSPITQRRRTGYWLGVAGLLAAAMLAIVLLRPEAPQISNRMKIESVASGPAHDALKIKPGGAGHWTVSANSRIAATADSTALFTWGKSLRGVLAQNAEVEGENDRALKLTSGAAWFWVEKGGKGVTVDTR